MNRTLNEQQMTKAVVVLLGALLFGMLIYCRALSRGIGRLETSLLQLSQNVAQLSAKLDQNSEALRRIEFALAKAGFKSDYSRVEFPELEVDHAKIKPGLYVLSKELRLRSLTGAEYYNGDFTIYNFKSTLSDGSRGSTIMLGIAVGGFGTLPSFYLDTDLDNRVDLEAMRSVADLLPMGSALKRTLNEENAQVIYNAFLRGYEKSSHTSVADMKHSGYSVVNSVMEFLEAQSSRLVELFSDQASEKK